MREVVGEKNSVRVSKVVRQSENKREGVCSVTCPCVTAYPQILGRLTALYNCCRHGDMMA